MRTSPLRPFRRLVCGAIAVAALSLAAPAIARAQYRAPELRSDAVGERYHVELAGSFWNSAPTGVISSDQFGIAGSQIDFVNDLAYEKTRFKDLKIVLRPGKKSKFRIEYVPIGYMAQTTLKRTVIFNGQSFNVNLPVQSTFGWKVWRLGYEYDFLYKPRGFVGMLLEARYTQFDATLSSPVTPAEFTSYKAPLPAIGVVGRAYVLPEVAINFEVSGFTAPNSLFKAIQKIGQDVTTTDQAHYYDWDINGTVNVTNNLGLQVGWRRMTNYLSLKGNFGDLKFQGMWFGAAVRY